MDKQTKVIFIDGLWGTAKTCLSVYCSLELMSQKRVSDIIYIRNPVESSTTGKMGYLPGESGDKMLPYVAHFHEKLDEFLTKADINYLTNENRFTCLPVGFIRGRSWNCKAIIVDEAASLSKDDLLLIMSRMGEFSKMFIIGDSLNQNDIGSKTGFRDIFNIFHKDLESQENGIFTMEFKDEGDILRSRFLRFLMRKLHKVEK